MSIDAHLSHDGNPGSGYIQWRDKAAWENILVDPGRQERWDLLLVDVDEPGPRKSGYARLLEPLLPHLAPGRAGVRPRRGTPGPSPGI
ncbi:hypothetical protein [Streptomyces sp. NPDC005784]|uniref:hypothetical protein n=1 Tax=Streptomyces sp. NPDC005784 TaxID=3364731 RepID=UPI003694D96F